MSDTKPIAAAIVGIAGHGLTEAERGALAQANPLGVILFGRNVSDRTSLGQLTVDIRRTLGRMDAPILIDQEGGRVARLGPPHWPARPPAAAFGALAERDASAARRAVFLNHRLIADDLAALGIDVNCAPCVDVEHAAAHPIISDRAFSSRAHVVSELGRAACDGLLAGGVVPVVKHVPGHGRAQVDSHVSLPEINASVDELAGDDWLPFAKLSGAHAMMTAHVRYTAVDGREPATTSPVVIQDVIRGQIGFDGVLFTDDIAMQALAGNLDERAAKARAAGCDVVLWCGDDVEDMTTVCEAAGKLEGVSMDRWQRARQRMPAWSSFDARAGERELTELFGVGAA